MICEAFGIFQYYKNLFGKFDTLLSPVEAALAVLPQRFLRSIGRVSSVPLLTTGENTGSQINTCLFHSRITLMLS